MARYSRRLLLAVDLRHYSRHTYDEQTDAQYRLRLVVEHALRRARVMRVRVQQQLQGDGQLVVFPARVDIVRAVPALVLGLRDGLYQVNQTPGAFGRLRMRAALGQGSLSRADRGYVGGCVVLVSRLVESEAVRQELERNADCDLALAVPDDLYRDAVVPQSHGLSATQFHRAEIVTPAKDFSATAWLHAPRSAPAADLGPEPVIWGHSRARTATKEFVVPALGAAHLAATALAHSAVLREWLLPGAQQGTPTGAVSADFDDTGVVYARPDAHDPHVGGPHPGSDTHHVGDGQHGGHHAAVHHTEAEHHAQHADGHHPSDGHHDAHAGSVLEDRHHGDPYHHDAQDPYHHATPYDAVHAPDGQTDASVRWDGQDGHGEPGDGGHHAVHFQGHG
ncbi:hypothetical protein ACFOSC_00795 [Streptantibioticus rubrisoli]|uniref:Uncharacterized protein n=1 Tax=Streptantibioticus rubrisoli TaxID=1387313 RepID=A0ABT1PD77_9ACTN|nr:hypothetical protein [Streptantibioticus rubrisoli]MCQ4043330.1 hypothetical protein [Streptantibioticus rubrisoli]